MDPKLSFLEGEKKRAGDLPLLDFKTYHKASIINTT
jgi:hypothetical protein